MCHDYHGLPAFEALSKGLPLFRGAYEGLLTHCSPRNTLLSEPDDYNRPDLCMSQRSSGTLQNIGRYVYACVG